MAQNGNGGRPTRTDLILRAVVAALERSRGSLDAAPAMTQVQIIVNFDEARDVPRKTSIRPETCWDLRASASRDSNGDER